MTDIVDWAGRPARLQFGLEARQTGKVQGQSIQGLLALDRSPSSFIGQVGGRPLPQQLARLARLLRLPRACGMQHSRR